MILGLIPLAKLYPAPMRSSDPRLKVSRACRPYAPGSAKISRASGRFEIQRDGLLVAQAIEGRHRDVVFGAPG